MRDIRISVIIPVYNRAGLIGRAIESVINQTEHSWELIVVDDHSDDGTKAVAEAYCERDDRIRYVYNEGKRGVAAARNYGILYAEGDCIAFLDSDDEWLPTHLKDSLTAMRLTGTSVSTGLWLECSADGVIHNLYDSSNEKARFERAAKEINNGSLLVFPSGDFLEEDMLFSLYCYHINTLVLERKVLEKVGLFSERLKSSEDVDFLYRIFGLYDFVLDWNYHFIYHQGGDNLYNFIDRKRVNIEEICNPQIVVRLTECIEDKCKSLKLRMKYIKHFCEEKDLSACLKKCKKKMARKYYTAAYINRNDKCISLKYMLKSYFCGEDKIIKLSMVIERLLNGNIDWNIESMDM